MAYRFATVPGKLSEAAIDKIIHDLTVRDEYTFGVTRLSHDFVFGSRARAVKRRFSGIRYITADNDQAGFRIEMDWVCNLSGRSMSTQKCASLHIDVA